MYNHKNIDKKWQDHWEKSGIFHAKDNDDREKFYCLVEFPYPSGAGLHMGHPRSYTAIDIIARKRRMQNKNVLYPIGWDAFGLPTENYAIKTKRKPQEVTAENIKTFKRQLQSLGISFDWSREINTTDPEYYKWTQWMFLEFFKAGLAYKTKTQINWCTSCKIGLANEEVVSGVCERCGGEVEKREKEQWMIKITEYADSLINDLKDLDYPDKIKKQQIDWIGKSEGAEIDFIVNDGNEKIKVFTTRPDTLFGVTYMVLAPEHPLVDQVTTIDSRDRVREYINSAIKRTDIDRADATQEKTGVFTGSYAINPINNKKVPIWIADYVLMDYGTGAIMAVPAHDERDFKFAEKFDLEIKQVIDPGDDKDWKGFTGDGIVVNSNEFDGLSTSECKSEIIKKLEDSGSGKIAINYRLRDWVFSRQRYWGEPIPLIKCEKCGWIPDENLPVVLPEIENYQPTDNGESPLASIDDWVNTKCPQCGCDAKRETDTMPNWAGSSWYFLRYVDPKNDKVFADPDKLKYWMPVDWYNGGMEHTTLHLLYSRFWNKFLHDQGYVPVSEPYQKRTSHGMVLAEDGNKMSKSRGNVINPDELVDEFGADTVRMYEMFMGPFSEAVPWSANGVVGVRRFLEKVWRFQEIIIENEADEVTRSLHQTIKKVTDDIELMRFNTAIAQMMKFVNIVQDKKGLSKETLFTFLQILSPFAPHLSDEIFEIQGGKGMLEVQDWPKFDQILASEPEMNIAIQVNGKLRATIKISSNAKEDEIVSRALNEVNVKKYLERDPKKTIYITGRLVNFVM